MDNKIGNGFSSLESNKDNPFNQAIESIDEFEEMFFPVLKELYRPDAVKPDVQSVLFFLLIDLFDVKMQRLKYDLKTDWAPRVKNVRRRNELIGIVFMEMSRLESKLLQSKYVDEGSLLFQEDSRLSEQCRGFRNVLEKNMQNTSPSVRKRIGQLWALVDPENEFDYRSDMQGAGDG